MIKRKKKLTGIYYIHLNNSPTPFFLKSQILLLHSIHKATEALGQADDAAGFGSSLLEAAPKNESINKSSSRSLQSCQQHILYIHISSFHGLTNRRVFQ